MAAEVMASDGLSVTVADAMPSVGRKFLMAGKSGLNLTKSEPIEVVLAAYGDAPEVLKQTVADFEPDAVMGWAEGLGQPLFTGSTGRVFPKAMKASPLLRAWLARLDRQGVTLKTRWRWQGWDSDQFIFDTPDGRCLVDPKVTVLALGGASWARLGSDGAWARFLPDAVAPFAPANMGFVVPWSAHMTRFCGQPVKSTMLRAGALTSRGEFIISSKGIEGGGIYAVSAAVRDGAPLTLDLAPDWTLDRLRAALSRRRKKETLTNHLRKALRFDPVHIALLSEFGRPFPDNLAPLIKSLPIRHEGPRPMDEAISTAGGVRFDALTDDLMLRDRPGVFCAGEMLDWEAPTGGYLITGCLTTGRRAAAGAVRYATKR